MAKRIARLFPLLTLLLPVSICSGQLPAQKEAGRSVNYGAAVSDSLVLRTDKNEAYYQQTVRLDSSIRLSTIYTRTLEFMATRNFQQTYGYEQEGKLIFSTQQDLNENRIYNDSENDNPQPYNVQFSMVMDIRNGRYRYAVRNVVFYLPTDNGTRRLTLYEVHERTTPGQPRHVIRDAKNLLDSFERYLKDLGQGLFTEIEHKAALFNPRF